MLSVSKNGGGREWVVADATSKQSPVPPHRGAMKQKSDEEMEMPCFGVAGRRNREQVDYDYCRQLTLVLVEENDDESSK